MQGIVKWVTVAFLCQCSWMLEFLSLEDCVKLVNDTESGECGKNIISPLGGKSSFVELKMFQKVTNTTFLFYLFIFY